MSEWGDAAKVFVKFSPNEERERERKKKRKTRGYVSRCPNFIHSHPFVCFSSVSVHLSCIRSFVLFIRSVFVCLFVEEASYFGVMVFAIFMEFKFRPVLGSSLLL
jgi:hypothetical protein